jgi:integrin beta 8
VKKGDFYLDTATHTLYGPKASGAWTATGATLVGPACVNGTDGLNGTDGTNGPDGNTILNGTGPPLALPAGVAS